ncbi:MAG: Ig-like domain-containing protein, partial [Bifidobacteriaceae bacterium]|nr:Ig-like domain-containing protein [Bifidobacteriaceae bacterium]
MSAAHSAKSTSALSLASVFKRLPRAVVRPVALLTAGAIALGGVTLAQSWMSSDEAQAITYSNGFDGVFKSNQLWLITATNSTFRAWDDPQALTSSNFTTPTTRFTTSGSVNGTGGSGEESIAVGPVFKGGANGTDNVLHMVNWATSGSGNVFVSGWYPGLPLNGYPHGGFQNSTAVNGNSTLQGVCNGNGTGNGWGSRYSGEINQKNGYVYIVGGGATPSIDSSLNFEFHAGIFRINAHTLTTTCMTAVKTVTGANGRTINQQWSDLGNGSITGNWDGSSDMAIDANGNLYLFARNGSSAHALIRFSVPHDSNGDPVPGGAWTYSIVKAFPGTVTNDDSVYGMAFMDGALYTQQSGSTNRIRRWDTLSGNMTVLGTMSGIGNARDLAGAQMAPVIEGRVYHDVNGDGEYVEGQDTHLPNMTLEFFQNTGTEDAPAWTKRGNLITDSEGRYSALINDAEGDYLVRLFQPTINNVKAYQTFARADSFPGGAGTNAGVNTVQPYCATEDADYQLVPLDAATNGWVSCYGARRDGIDKAPTNMSVGAAQPVLSDAYGAAMVSRVKMNTWASVVSADFGVSAAQSWGDAPSPYLTKYAEGGPYATPRVGATPRLYLGDIAGVDADGVHDPESNARVSDDGFEIAPYKDNQFTDADFVPAQSYIMTAGDWYQLRAKVSGEPDYVAASNVRGWMTGITNNAADQGWTTRILGVTDGNAGPNVDGYVTLPFQAPTVTAAHVPVYARIRVSDYPGIMANTRPENAAAAVQYGEIEDYQLSVATSVAKIQARTLGNVPANVALSVSNVVNQAPSRTSTTITTDNSSAFMASRDMHAVQNRNNPVTITTQHVGATDATSLSGWKLSARADDTYCWDTKGSPGNQADRVATSVNSAAGTFTVSPPSGGQLPGNFACRVTYIPSAVLDQATVTAVPSDNESDPLLVAEGHSDVKLNVTGTVRDDRGVAHTLPAYGQPVVLNLAPKDGTLATATGARFEYLDGADWVAAGQSYTCIIGDNADCNVPVRVVATRLGGYDLSATVDGGYVPNADGSGATDQHPVPIWFTFLPPDESQSKFEITSTGQKFISATNGTDADEYHTAVITLKDREGNPVTGAVAGSDPKLTWDSSAPPANRVVITENTGAGAEGTYAVKIWSADTGTFGGSFSDLKVKYTTTDDPPKVISVATTSTIAFRTRDPEADRSSMVVTTTPDQYANHDAPGSSVATWGKQTVTVTLQDSGNNPYPDAVARGALVASSPDTGVYFGAFTCAAALVDNKCVAGVYKIDVYASLAGAKKVEVTYTFENGTDTFKVKEAGADPRNEYVTAVFVEPPADPDYSVFLLAPGETTPGDNWDDPSDEPDTQVVTHDVGGAYHANVRVWDAGRNNPVPNIPIRLALSNDPAAALSCAARFAANGATTIQQPSNAAGKFGPEINSAVAGTCVVTAEIQVDQVNNVWAPIKGSPKTLTWQDSGIDSADFTVSTAGVVANGTDTGTITVHAMNANGTPNTTGAGSIAASCDKSSVCHMAFSAFTHSSTTPGEYTATFTGTASSPTANDWKIKVSAGAIQDVPLVSGGNDVANMIPGPVLASASWLIQPNGTKVADGQEAFDVRLHARDEYNNDVANGTPVTFHIPVGTKSGSYVGPIDVPATTISGYATISVTSTVATDPANEPPNYHVVTAKIGADSVVDVRNALEAETPLARNDGEVWLEYVPAANPPADASWLVQPSGTAVANGSATLAVRAHIQDSNGNNAANGTPVVFTIPAGTAVGSTSGPAAIPATTTGGYATILVTSEVATDAANEPPAYHVVTAKLGAASVAAVRDSDETPTAIRNNGEVQLEYTPIADPQPGTAWLVQPAGTAVANGSATLEVKAHVQDAKGNNAANETAVTFHIPAGTTSGTFTGPADIPTTTTGGYASILVSSEVATDEANTTAYHVVTARLSTGSITNVRNSDEDATPLVRSNGEVWLEYTPASNPPADASWLVQPSGSAVANGTVTQDVKAHIQDSKGNNAANGTVVTFRIPEGTKSGSVVGPNDVTATTVSGIATIAVSSTVATDGVDSRPTYHAVTARIDAGAISTVKDVAEAQTLRNNGEVQLKFDNPDVDPAESWLIQPDGTKTANGTDYFTVSVHAKGDSVNNAADGTNVTFQVPAGATATAGAQTVVGPNPITVGTVAGYASVQVTSTVATDAANEPPEYHVVTATAGGGAIQNVRNAAEAAQTIRTDGQVWLEYTPASNPPADASWLVQPSGSVVANSGDTLDVKAHVQDARGNNAADHTVVSFSIPANTAVGATTGPAVIPAETVGGIATISVTSTVATDGVDGHPTYYVVTATVASGQILKVRNAAEDATPLVRENGQVQLKFDNPDVVDPAESWLIQPDGDQLANGTDALTASVHAKADSVNNVKDGTSVTFHIPAGTTSGTYTGPADVPATTTAGIASILVTSTVATDAANEPPAHHVVTAEVAAGQIMAVRDSAQTATPLVRNNGEIWLEYTPLPPNPGTSWIVQPSGSAEANGSDAITVNAVVKDAQGNNVKDGTQVRFHIPAGTSSAANAGPNDIVATTTNGVASIPVTSSTANTTANPYYAVTAQMRENAQAAWVAVTIVKDESGTVITGQGSEARLVFGAGPVAEGTSWLVQPDEPNPGVIANGTATQTVKVHAKDASGNDAGTGTIVFHVPSGLSVNGQAGPRDVEVAVAAGWAQIEVATKVAAGSPYSITASVKGAGAITQVKNALETSVLTGRDDVRLTFVPGPVDPVGTAASLTVDPEPKRADAVASVPAYMTIQDVDGNPIAGLTGCSFELIYDGTDGARFGNAGTGGKTTTVTTPSGADGRCTVDIRSYHEGFYPVKGIYSSGQGAPVESPGPLEDRPVATFSNVPINAFESEFKVEPTVGNHSADRVVADGSDSYTVTVYTRNADGGIVTGQSVSVCYALVPGGTPDCESVIAGAGSNPAGTATRQLKTTTAGTYAIDVKVAGAPIATTPRGSEISVSRDFVAGPVAKREVKYSEGTAKVSNIGQHSAEVTLYDANDNLVSGQNVVFILSAPTLGHFVNTDGISLGSGNQSVTTSVTGKATVLIRNSGTVDEDVMLAIREGSAGGAIIGDNPTHTFQFRTGGASPDRSTFVITPDPTVTANQLVANGSAAYTGVVTVRDDDGVPLSGSAVTFDFNQPGVTVSPAGPYTTDINGQVTVSFRSTSANTYRVNADVGGGNARPENQTITFVPGAPSAIRSTLEVTPGQALANGTTPHNAWVVVRDANGNPVRTAQDVFFTVETGAVGIEGPTITPTSAVVESCDFSAADKPEWCTATGMAQVTIRSNEPGTFKVNAYLGTTAVDANRVAQSPQDIQFSAGEPDPARSSRTVSPDTDATPTLKVEANGNGSYLVETTIISTEGILVDKANVRLVLVEAGSPVQVTPLDSDDPQLTGVPMSDHYGKYSWTLTSIPEGDYSARVEVRANGQWNLVGVPVKLGFKGGEVNDANSWLVEPDGTRIANGTSEFTVQAVAKDRSGNAATTGQVVFGVPAGVTAVGAGSGGSDVAGPADVPVDVAAGSAA